MRKRIMLVMLLFILLLANGLIVSKERLLANGEVVLLELAPRDPRSILQGDYMSLRYHLARDIAAALKTTTSISAEAVIQLDENRVAHFIRLYEAGTTLAADERLLYFRKRGRHVRLATDAYFFQEGSGKLYRAARYGALVVGSSGDAVLVGLRDAQFRPISNKSLKN